MFTWPADDKVVVQLQSWCRDIDSPAANRLTGLIQEIAGHPDVVYGDVGPIGDRIPTAYEWGTPRLGITIIDNVVEARTRLRGYSWITVVPAELVERISATRLADATRDLFECRRLANGNLWLRATEHYRDFGDEELRRVFLALVDVLPDGAPVRSLYTPRALRLIYEDPAPYRMAGDG